MSMIISTSLSNFLEIIMISVNNTVREITNNVKDTIIFMPISIEFNIKCSLDYNNTIKIIPSNALVKNYYKKGNDAIINIKVKPKPKGGYKH
mgnify:CR=1 FL=1